MSMRPTGNRPRIKVQKPRKNRPTSGPLNESRTIAVDVDEKLPIVKMIMMLEMDGPRANHGTLVLARQGRAGIGLG